jgi:hypothetical protein
MRIPRKPVALCCAIVLAGTIAPAAMADDGFLVRKSMSHEGPGTDDSNDPVSENEHAFIQSMNLYVPIQEANGSVLTAVPYLNIDETEVDQRDYAKPLIGVYVNGPVEGVDGVGFVGHGKRDAYGAVSLDDGETWKNTNLSESADESSSDVFRDDIDLFDDTDHLYPGDVVNIFHAVAGDRVLVAWPSRYCSSGQPNYSLDNPDNPDNLARRQAIADYLEIDLTSASPEALYLVDMYGVGGQQGWVDYAEDRWPQNQPVGEVPYSCLWTARGQLIQGDDPRTEEATEASYMRWFNAERLTSGRRDVNRIETQCVTGAGCAITWQEDPEGLRGGQGEGPGEGWSGAVANSQTDIWYSYIDWENFNVVQDPDDATIDLTMQEYEERASDPEVTQKPKPFVPFAMPMRLTDNAKCNVNNPQPYCYGAATPDTVGAPDFFPSSDTTVADYGLRDMCADTVDIVTGRDDTPTPVCVTEDGLPLVGNTASTRPRLNVFGYGSSPSQNAEIDSAFAVVVAEEDKGLGSFGFDSESDQACEPNDGPPVEGDTCVAFDEGKNIWYHSFSMSLADDLKTGNNDRDELSINLASHWNMLNQPEVDWTTGEFYPLRNTVDMWDFGDYNFDIYNTEIARRGSLLAQSIDKARDTESGLVALPTWKQGAMNQGGPADVMARRIVIPKNWNVNKGNPYAFRNLACDNWAFRDDNGDGTNPQYPEGLCMDSAINMSGSVPDTCVDSSTGDDVACPQVDLSQGTTFGISDTNPILQGREVDPNTTKVLTWHQCPADFTTVTSSDGVEVVTCETDLRTDDSTLADQSWYNPLEVAKGHRGFLDGVFVIILYAWSPNWRLNTKGSDRYELYIRRSFDGAQTWTTTPSSFDASDGNSYSGDGTVTCETWRTSETGTGGDTDEPRVCNEYGAGAAEQARNVTQHKSMRTTTLDPRYSPTAATLPATVEIDDESFLGWQSDEDTRNPSRYFVVYETGDNSTTAEGEPEPLDLFYSRAINFGDDYAVWAEETDLSVCYPSDPHDQDVPAELIDSGFCNEFDQMEQGIPGLEASEASLTANPGGEFLYGAWAQILLDDMDAVEESDAMARRVWFIDDYISLTEAWDFGQGSNN